MNMDIGKDLQNAYEEGYKQGRYDEMVETEMSLLKWIPVSEKLPEKNGWYLITVYGYEHIVDMFWYYHESNQWNGVSDLEKVVAWMPLPAPYREEYELATEQMEHDALYEPTYNPEDGSM